MKRLGLQELHFLLPFESKLHIISIAHHFLFMAFQAQSNVTLIAEVLGKRKKQMRLEDSPGPAGF